MSLNYFEINEDKKIKMNFVSEFYVFLCYVKEEIVGPVKILVVPVDPRCYWSYGASEI